MYCIAGADGFFGAYLQRELYARGERVLALNHGRPAFPQAANAVNLPFDVTQRSCIEQLQALLQKEDRVRVIYLIASHNPDFVRENPERAAYINHTAYTRFLECIAACPVEKLYYASSDTVYGESVNGHLFTEEDVPAPVNIYGEHKQKAEELTLQCGFHVARFSYMYAPSLTHKKHFFDELTDALRQGHEIRMLTDYVRSALSYKTAAACLLRLMDTQAEQHIFNICGDAPFSKYEIGLQAAAHCGASPELVVPVSQQTLRVFSEKRASVLLMANKRLKVAIGEPGEIAGTWN